jgi:hypothetical protein
VRRFLFAWLVITSVAPAAPAQDAIPLETVSEVKEATVFIKDRVGSLQVSGSGFVIQADRGRALVATNAHVVAPKPRTVRGVAPPAVVSVIFRSGSKGESTLGARLLAADPSRD